MPPLERAAEFLEVTKALWDSVEDDAMLLEKAQAISRIREDPPHQPRGKVFPGARAVECSASAAGPSGHRPGRLVRRRQEPRGGHADIHFAGHGRRGGQRYRKDFDAASQRAGREPADLKILPGILPIVAASRAEAKEKRDFLETLVPERVGVDLVSSWSGMDLSGFAIDGPLPPLPDVATYDGQRSNLERLQAFARDRLTIREVARRISNAGQAGARGTPSDVADELEAWYVAGAADGFNLMFPVLPLDLVEFRGPRRARAAAARVDARCVCGRHAARAARATPPCERLRPGRYRLAHSCASPDAHRSGGSTQSPSVGAVA